MSIQEKSQSTQLQSTQLQSAQLSSEQLLSEQSLSECAELARILGNVHRLSLLQYLSTNEYGVESLAKSTGLSIANTSQHLQQLKRVGFVDSRREGKQIIYRLSKGPVLNILAALFLFSEHNRQEISLMINQVDENNKLPLISYDELIHAIKQKDVLLLDVRPVVEYRKGHLPHALNIPVESLEDNLVHLPRNKDIITYCRGPYCFLSANAVMTLNMRGYQAKYFKEGIQAWINQGEKIEKFE